MVATAPVRDGQRAISVEEAQDRVDYLSRWLRVWLGVLVVATLVVVAYLIVIGNSLYDVVHNLGETRQQVNQVQQDVNQLPEQIGTINTSLAHVADAVATLPADVHRVNGALSSVSSDLDPTVAHLDSTAADLGDTRNLLHTTTGDLGTIEDRLKSTASTLSSVYALTGDIHGVLEDAESPPDQLGAKDIYQHVAVVNAALAPVHQDTGNILATVKDVNTQLTSICLSPLLYVLGLAPPCVTQ